MILKSTHARFQILYLWMIPILLMTGCKENQSEINESVHSLKAWVQKMRTLSQEKLGLPVSKSGHSAEEDLLESVSAKKAKQNGELLSEMYGAVYTQPTDNRAFFADWHDSMNQGASLEGVYNAFTHSSIYRELEMKTEGENSKSAVKTFAAELVRLQNELRPPLVFDEESAKPLAVITNDIQSPRGKNPIRPGAMKNPAELAKLKQSYEALFAKSSFFTLKRVLGDGAMLVIQQKKGDKKKLAEWYADYVLVLNRYGVDFGLKQRNSADRKFHYNWAMSVSEDLLTWELLNRLHRVLNAKR